MASTLQSSVQARVPGFELGPRLLVERVGDDAVHRAGLDAPRALVGADALRTSPGLDDEGVGGFVPADRFVRALRLASRAVDEVPDDRPCLSARSEPGRAIALPAQGARCEPSRSGLHRADNTGLVRMGARPPAQIFRTPASVAPVGGQPVLGGPSERPAPTRLGTKPPPALEWHGDCSRLTTGSLR